MKYNIDWILIIRYLEGNCSETDEMKIHEWENKLISDFVRESASAK